MVQKNLFSTGRLIIGLTSLFIGTVGLLTTIFLVGSPVIFQGKAAPTPLPKEIKLTNISPNSISISFITDETSIGAVTYSQSNEMTSPQTSFDDYTSNLPSSLHHFTLKNLSPSSVYYFRLISNDKTFDNQGTPYTFSTPPTIKSLPKPPFTIKGTLSKKALVYFSFNDSTSVSTLTDDNNRFLLSLNNALTRDFKKYYPAQMGEKGYLLISYGPTSETKEIVVSDDMTVAQTASPKVETGSEPTALSEKLPPPTEGKRISHSLIEQIINFLTQLFLGKKTS